MDGQTTLTAIATCAAVASATSLVINAWKQSIRPKKPNISLLNDESNPQRAGLVPFERFPQSIKNVFPAYTGAEAQNGALVRLLFSNSGDGDGFITIDKVEAINLSEWKPSFYTQNIVGAKSYCIHDIVLRGIPDLKADKEITLKLKVSWGGPGRKTETITKAIKINLFTISKPAGEKHQTES